MTNIYHTSEVIPLHSYNSVHAVYGAIREASNAIKTMQEVVGHGQQLPVDILRVLSVEINGLIRQANLVDINNQLVERGIVK